MTGAGEVGYPQTGWLSLRGTVHRLSTVANLAAVPVIVAAWLGIWWTQLHATLPAHDAGAYWRAGQDLGTLYETPWNQIYAYVYSPAFAQVISPLAQLPFEAFYLVWSGLSVLALTLLCGPILAALLLVAFSPVQSLIAGGNIHLLMALALALGFRYPGAWAFVLLTKVTPGIGLLWFAVRREWASLVRALAVTAGIVIVSLALAPHAWLEWAARLITSPDTAPPASAVIYVPLPLIPRLLLAAGITTWAALTDRRWAVFIAAAVALPVSSGGAVDLLLGALPLLGYGPLARVVHHDPRPVRVALNADLEARWRPVQAQQS